MLFGALHQQRAQLEHQVVRARLELLIESNERARACERHLSPQIALDLLNPPWHLRRENHRKDDAGYEHAHDYSDAVIDDEIRLIDDDVVRTGQQTKQQT